MLDCITFRFTTVVVNDKILQVSIYTFLTLSMYSFVVWYTSFLNSLRVCTALECYLISKIDIWIETNSPLESVLGLFYLTPLWVFKIILSNKKVKYNQATYQSLIYNIFHKCFEPRKWQKANCHYQDSKTYKKVVNQVSIIWNIVNQNQIDE